MIWMYCSLLNHSPVVGFPCGSTGKESFCNAGDLGLIPGLGRAAGEGKDYPLQYSGLENSMDCVVQFSSVQLLGHVRLFVTQWTAARQASLSITKSQSLLKLMSIESVMPSNHLILCHPLLFLPSIFPSIRVFSNESALCIRWTKYWSFSFNISPSHAHSGLISFRMDWFDLLAVQGTLKSLLQHHSSKASILQRSAFFIVQLLHPYMTTGKAIALTRWTFVGKVTSLLFNMYCPWGHKESDTTERLSLSRLYEQKFFISLM